MANACRLQGLLADAACVLGEHADELKRFEQSLETEAAKESEQRGDELDDRIRDVRWVNEQVEQTLDKVSARLAAATSDFPSADLPDFEAYQEKTAAFDHTLESLSLEALLAGIAVKLLGVVRDLRQDNVSLRQEVLVAKDQIIEQMSRAHAAEQIARVDALTQLPNRRALEEAHGQCQTAMERHGQPYCLVLFDLDHFKQVNDQYGHAAGDAVLAMVARVFRENQRTADLTCRLGGEEFALLLPQCEERSAKSVAERYRQKIESAVLHYRDQKLAVTMSGGVAQAAPNESLGRLLERADAALYVAKSLGRNRICVPLDAVRDHSSDAHKEVHAVKVQPEATGCSKSEPVALPAHLGHPNG